MSTKPLVICVGGFWAGHAGAWTAVVQRLHRAGYATITAAVSCTGCAIQGGPEMADDIALIRMYIEPAVRRGRAVCLLTHSAGAFIAGASIKGLTRPERQKARLPGGVFCYIMLAGTLLLEDVEWPFLDFQGDKTLCRDPRNNMFNDLPEAEAERWASMIQPEPHVQYYQTEVDPLHEGYLDVPCYYLMGTQDRLITPPLARLMAAAAKAELEEIDAAHAMIVSRPDDIVEYTLRVMRDLGEIA